MQAFGYTVETMQFMLLPLVRELRDPVGSMGNDSALACLSDKPRMLYDYFKQLFAQVTNPAIDSIREEVIMSLECYIGPEQNLLETTEEHAHRLRIPHPILSNEQLAALKHLNHRGWRTKTIDITWPRSEGQAGLTKAIERVCAEAEAAIDEGYSLVVLVGSGSCSRPRAAELAAGDRGRAPSFGAEGEADADWHRRRIGRGARGASSLPARGLWRRCDQSVSGV